MINLVTILPFIVMHSLNQKSVPQLIPLMVLKNKKNFILPRLEVIRDIELPEVEYA